MDPAKDAVCGIPGQYCRRETVVEDDFHNQDLIFHYEEVHEGLLGGAVSGMNKSMKGSM